MLQQKQGARVRISSQEKVINMSEVYNPCDSICSCQQCDSVDCFNVRNINSGIPCTCSDCDPNRCLTWEITRCDAPNSNNETRNMDGPPETSKNLLNLPELTIKNSIRDTIKYTERPINSTNKAKKEKISISYLSNHLQTNASDDTELKEVFTKEERLKGKGCAIKNLIENKNNDDLYLKETSSNENSDIIECGASHLLKNHSNDPEIIQVIAKDGSDTKICCSKNKCSEIKNARDHETQQSSETKNKQLSSKISMPLPQNETSCSDAKGLLTTKLRNYCRQKNTTGNIKSDFHEAYQIYTNEKKNIVKCCNISKGLEKKNADSSENNQDNPESNIKYCKESKDVLNYKVGSTESNLEINTKIKIINTKCNYEHPIKDKISDKDFGNYTKYTYKDVSHTRNKINMNKNNKSYEKYVSRLQSVAVSYARPDYQNSRAELSAQIMNVPYDEFKESLSRKQSSTNFSTCNSSTKLEKNDIFTRLKEIYKACSCKVCECIAGKSLFNSSDICKCGPCECDDCNGYMANLKKKINNAPHSGCPCVRCDRKDCRGIVRSDYIACDCKPCDCVKCSESFTKPCSCIPCQCETCKTSIFMPHPLMVANAAESFQQSNCDCEPCECTNCTSGYSAMTSNLMREVATGIVAYGNCNCEDCSNNTCQLGRSDCRCESQNKVITKPMAERKPDYGIHRVYINENKYEKKAITKNNHDTITMFALSNNYPNKLFNYSNNKNKCECEVCECIVCKDKEREDVTNISLKIEHEKPNSNINGNNLNNSECSTRIYESCESVHDENVKEKNVETRHDACNSTNSKHVGYNLKIINSNENFKFKKGNPKFSTFENKCSSGCKNLVNVHSQNSTDTEDGYLYDNDKCYRLKRGTVLTPSMFQYNGLSSYSSHKHIKPEKDSIREYDLQKKMLTDEQNTKLCRSKSQHNYFDNDNNEDIINETPEAVIKVKSTNNSLFNMLLKEVGTKEIYKTNSVDFKKGNVSKIFFESSKSNGQNDDNNTILLDVTRMTSKPLSHYNKNLEYNKNKMKCSQTSLLDRQEVDNFYDITMSSSNNDIHFSSSKSMSLVKLLCEERNLNINKKNTRTLLQSLEKIPLKRLKMDEENISYICDKSLNDGIFLDSFTKDNYIYSINNNITNNVVQDKLNSLNCEDKKFETNLTDKKMDNYYIYNKNIVKAPISKTTKQTKPKEKSNFQIVERKPNNHNIRAKGSVVQPNNSKPRSKGRVANTNLKSKTVTHSKDSDNKFNNKRYLEIPDVINTAASAIDFTESDKRIDFETSLKLLKEVNYGYDENKKASPILRKNFFISPEVKTNKGICSIPLLQLDTKNVVKSTNTIFPYCPGVGFANKTLTKLRSEVNDLLYSPLLQLSEINGQREKFWSKNNFNSEIHCPMSDATSQTKRKNVVVDKEINCNMFESKENLRHSIQNLINTTLTNVVQCTEFETRKQNLIRDFNKVSSLNSAKSSCGGLRASFVGLRKVSDHSVLLKWAMPRVLTNIQGYELQVDGRPVKKILNPSRCMAVLTCLPHCDKLLLTIRTITNFETCHSPVTTIIYNPKKNKSGL